MSEDGAGDAATTRRATLKALARLGLIGAMAVAVILALKFTPLGAALAPERIEAAMDSLGWAAVPLFILVYAVLIAIWVPGTFMTLAGAALFGPVAAIPINYTGAVLGAWLGFHIARRMGGDALDHLFGGRLHVYDRYRDLIRRRGFESVLYLRMIPTPYTALSYLAGLSPVSAGRYTLATAIGILPGSIAITFLMGTVIEEVQAGNLSALVSVKTVAALALFGAAALVPTFARHARRRWGWFEGLEDAE